MHTRSAEETRAAGLQLAESLAAGDIVLLVGELGAGKTTFVKGVADGLGVDERVTSPTFTLVRTYDGVRLRLVHIDAYRLRGPGDWEELGVDEMLADPARPSVALIEWGDVVAAAIASPVRTLRFEHVDEHTRSITCS